MLRSDHPRKRRPPASWHDIAPHMCFALCGAFFSGIPRRCLCGWAARTYFAVFRSHEHRCASAPIVCGCLYHCKYALCILFCRPAHICGGGPVNRLLKLLLEHISEVPGPGPTFGRIFSNLASPRGWMLPILSYCRESARMSLRSGFYHGLWQLYDLLQREPDDVRRQK